MDWLEDLQILLSVGTFLVVIYQAHMNNSHKKIDRKIGVKVKEQREKQRKLFDHIVEILHAESKFIFSDAKAGKKSPVQLESIKHRIGVITNINTENKHGLDLRNECLELTYWFSGDSSRMKEKESSYIKMRDQAVVNIWFIIEDYLKEEERLIGEMVK